MVGLDDFKGLTVNAELIICWDCPDWPVPALGQCTTENSQGQCGHSARDAISIALGDVSFSMTLQPQF